MIKSLYFDNTAYQYAYELERLIRNFSLPHRLEFYTDKTPDGTDYAYCCADNGKLSVTVSDNDTVYKESSDVFADVWKGTVTLRFRGEYLREYAP